MPPTRTSRDKAPAGNDGARRRVGRPPKAAEDKAQKFRLHCKICVESKAHRVERRQGHAHSYPGVEGLQRHLAVDHEVMENVAAVCNHCSWKFRCASDLRRHQRNTNCQDHKKLSFHVDWASLSLLERADYGDRAAINTVGIDCQFIEGREWRSPMRCQPSDPHWEANLRSPEEAQRAADAAMAASQANPTAAMPSQVSWATPALPRQAPAQQGSISFAAMPTHHSSLSEHLQHALRQGSTFPSATEPTYNNNWAMPAQPAPAQEELLTSAAEPTYGIWAQQAQLTLAQDEPLSSAFEPTYDNIWAQQAQQAPTQEELFMSATEPTYDIWAQQAQQAPTQEEPILPTFSPVPHTVWATLAWMDADSEDAELRAVADFIQPHALEMHAGEQRHGINGMPFPNGPVITAAEISTADSSPFRSGASSERTLPSFGQQQELAPPSSVLEEGWFECVVADEWEMFAGLPFAG